MNESGLLAKLLYKCHMVSGENCVKGKTFVVLLCQTNMEMFTINVPLLKRPKTEVQLNLDSTNFYIINYMSSVQRPLFLAPVIV